MYLGLGVFLLAQREGFVSALPRATRAFAPKQFFPTLFCCLCRAKPAARENPIVRLTLGTDFPSPNIWVLSAARGEEKMIEHIHFSSHKLLKHFNFHDSRLERHREQGNLSFQ
jgi:hypothetical protein